jgi:alpha-L-fucosidase 2
VTEHEITRRTVLGTTLGGLAAAAIPAAAGLAHADPIVAAPWALDNRMATDTQWADFLRGQDLLWRRLPNTWLEGPFLGDGRLGTSVYKEPNANAVRLTVQHGESQDHRPQFGSLYGLARLPVGHLTLRPIGTISSVNWRLNLWDGELTGTITTGSGSLSFQVFIRDQVLVASVTPTGSEQVRWTFVPEEAISPRVAFEPPPSGYAGNPAPAVKTNGDVNQVTQSLTGGGQTATAYRQIAGPATNQRLLYLTVAHSFPATTAEATALNRVRSASAQPLADYVDGHRAWWHAFYRKSFISIPDQRLQSFHWIQLYKIASGTRAGGPILATCGPWLEPTPWPGVWWNLNVQLEYWVIHGSNHLELDTIATTLAANQQQLINNVPSQYRSDSSGVGRSSDMFANRGVPTPGSTGTPEVGDLTWALHNVWLSWRHTMDDGMLRNLLFPLLRRAINYYLHFLSSGTDGRLHLPTTHSPEYGNAPDANYDLSLIRWGCRTLLESAQRLGINDPLAQRWRDVLSQLTLYPVDGTGYMIGRGVPYAKSHRHYSHLLMVYPLYDITWEQPENRALIERSVRHWHSITGAHRGYSYTGAASMFASMGKADEALSFLLRFFDTSTSFPVRPNTMYTEAGPVVETPLSASQSMHDMLCTSWGGVIRVFPAVPSVWPDVTLHDFLAQGAFLVTAVRSGGVTRFVRLRSLAGEPCRVRPGITPGGASTTLQAENATISGGVVESNHAGFTGTGFVNTDNAIGPFVEFPIDVPAGPFTLTFRFANGTTVNRPMTLSVDGGVLSTLNFPGTGAWTTWATASATVNLTVGRHLVRVTATSANGGPNLDSLQVTAQQAAALVVTLDDGTPATWRDLGNGVIEIDLARDREVLIHAAGTPPPLTVAPVTINKPGPAWGLP